MHDENGGDKHEVIVSCTRHLRLAVPRPIRVIVPSCVPHTKRQLAWGDRAVRPRPLALLQSSRSRSAAPL